MEAPLSHPALDHARAFNASSARKADSPWLAVPARPSIAMMRSALAAADAVRPGDRAGDWLRIDPDDGWGDPLLHPDLVAAFGVDEAFRMAVAADVWSACLRGLDEWLSVRAAEGSTPFGEGWLRPMPDSCPPCGWPAAKDGETEEHRAFARDRGPAFAYDRDLEWHVGPHSGARIAPVRANSIMGLRGSQSSVACLDCADFTDFVPTEAMPFVPGYSREGRMDEEERPWILAAALWRGAVAEVLSGSGERDAPMLEHPAVQGLRLKHVVADSFWGALRAAGVDALMEGPWAAAALSSPLGRIEMSATDAHVSWNWEAADGRGASERGVRLSGSCPKGLGRAFAGLGPADAVAASRTLRAD